MTTTPLPWRATRDGDVYDADGQIVCATAPDDAARIVAAVNAQAALTMWACEGCGARFPQYIRPELLSGVTHCSRCVEVQVFAERGTAAQRAADGLREALELEHGRVVALEAALRDVCDEFVKFGHEVIGEFYEIDAVKPARALLEASDVK